MFNLRLFQAKPEKQDTKQRPPQPFSEQTRHKAPRIAQSWVDATSAFFLRAQRLGYRVGGLVGLGPRPTGEAGR